MHGDEADGGDGEQGEREPAHAARGEQRYGEHDDDAEGREEEMALDEVVGRQPLADGDGRARRQRQDEAGDDEGEDRADEHMVDGEPPVGDTAAVGARQPHRPSTQMPRLACPQAADRLVKLA